MKKLLIGLMSMAFVATMAVDNAEAIPSQTNKERLMSFSTSIEGPEWTIPPAIKVEDKVSGIQPHMDEEYCDSDSKEEEFLTLDETTGYIFVPGQGWVRDYSGYHGA